ncbi:MAG TPA: TetR/AcrR family transcriptional regulator [Ramlibacter sp.]|nr:TetR/AcrR family transcriptional regulator [Ramlibacter sp.]
MARNAKTPRSEQKDATRDQILEAATKLLAEHGYAALRVAAVANEAGVSLGGQLHHFPSKDSLVVAVLERLSARVLELAVQEAARIAADDDIFLAISRSAERLYAAPEFLIYLDIFLSVRRHTLVGDTAIRLLVSQRAATEALWLPHLTQRGIPDEEAILIIRALWGLSRGLAISSAGEQGKSGNQATIDFVIHALRRSCSGRPA